MSTVKVMLCETIFNDDFERNIVALKNRYRVINMSRRTIFSATFRSCNMLQVFESDSKTYNNVAEFCWSWFV